MECKNCIYWRDGIGCIDKKIFVNGTQEYIVCRYEKGAIEIEG